MLRPANEIVPFDHAAIEPEAPMRLAALRFELGAILIGELQRGAVIDRRRTTRHLALAAAVKFIRRFIAGIKPARGAQALRDLVIVTEPLRLPLDAMRRDAEPVEIGGDASANSSVERAVSVSS